jgi:hypothetical protein
MKLSLSILVCLSTLLMSACESRFKTAAESCAINQAVRVSFVDFSIRASDDEYRPYLQDILTAMQEPSTLAGEPISAEAQSALDKIDELFKGIMFYEKVDNGIESEFVFTNSLDLLEAMISTTNPSTVIETDDEGNERNISKLIGAFATAKQQLTDGIEADDGSCLYSNSNIIIENYVTENPDTEASNVVFKNILQAQFQMTYNPFVDTFQQVVTMLQTENDPSDPNNPNNLIDLFNLNDELKTIQTSYSGGFQALPSEFKTVGYTPTFLREGQITPDHEEFALNITEQDITQQYIDSTQPLDIDINPTQLGTVIYETFDAFCTLKNTKGDIAFLDNDTLTVLGDTLTIQTIEGQDTIIIDGSPLSINGSDATIDTLIKDGELLTINDDTFTITGITVVLDGKALLIDSSPLMAVSETNQTFAVILCADDIETIEPVRDECDGGLDAEKNSQTDERNRREARSFDLNTEHTGIKRLRVETNYLDNDVKVYVSKYKERIQNAPKPEDMAQDDYIPSFDDPSRCEKQAILDELALLTPGEGVSLTIIPDPVYDFVFNDDEESGTFVLDEDQLPTPAYTFTGTAIPARQ